MGVILLAIESSCDETAAAVLKDGKILANVVANQTVHEQYGGVVPELASREHQKNIIPVVAQALQEAKITKSELNAVAFTRGPGLLGALLVGTSFAKGLALSLNIPLVEVNHMEAHIMAHFIDEPHPPFPFLCLTVSGGHTQLVIVSAPTKMHIIGETIDDAVGEAFDKTAKLLGLPYPGGPMVDAYAQKGNPRAFPFTKPNIEGLNFSFSGVKTAILYFLRAQLKDNPDFITENLADICASVQHTLVSILLDKLKQAAQQYQCRHIAIAGGVSANSGLRQALETAAQTEGWQVYLPAFEYCTDNAAMIAIAGYHKYLAQDFSSQAISPMPRMPIPTL
ncbi:tRNA (adenosine(37)-N6)-threonylcarbamoyltransferase complex transferase subunit TsaD [Eisenibacter elegans]|jgi:N6-L-threonylcarbamoyladenine synthase|uniref:tRNA (adenosine(37)-N6)-threonylcarbamoyltransferase complex transferase subunit TsaD n=1 Tax=Eisenibacter elegans TaxID=997 RepID=UPI000478C74F|nr:tRNA (adenosine(37)-N6)-threonylcarbamoyltransferase complex transferase subunit TsaD [Eisenibacter elegans]